MAMRSLALAALVACASPPTVAPDTPLAADAPALDARPEYHGRPLLLLLHGYGGNGPAIAAAWGDAPALGPVILAPSSPTHSWNASQSCCYTQLAATPRDDVAALSALVEARIAQGDIDAARVFVAGHSNGGFMAWRLLCERADLFAAGVILDGAANSEHDAPCAPSHPLRVLHVHGTADPTVSYVRSLDLFGMPDWYVPTIGPGGSLDQEATAAGCTSALRPAPVDPGLLPPTATASGPTALDGWTRDCAGRADLWRNVNGGHSPQLGPGWMAAVLGWAVAVTP